VRRFHMKKIIKTSARCLLNTLPGHDKYFFTPKGFINITTPEWISLNPFKGHRAKLLNPGKRVKNNSIYFLPEDKEIFENNLKEFYEIPDLFLLEFNNTMVSKLYGLPLLPGGVLPKDVVSIDPGMPDRLFRNVHLSPAKRIKGTVAVFHSKYPSNYFHWLFDSLSKAISHVCYHENSPDWFYGYASTHIQRFSLSSIGIDLNRIISPFDFPYLLADRLLIVTLTRRDGAMNEIIMKAFLNISSTSNYKSLRRVYISREDAQWRRVINENEVIRCLKNYHFQPIVLSQLSFEDQISIFKNAECIVAPHGAGLANIIWTPNSSAIVEFFSPDGLNDEFISNSASVGRTHYCLLAKGSDNLAANDMYKDIDLDVSKLERIVRNELGFLPS